MTWRSRRLSVWPGAHRHRGVAERQAARKARPVLDVSTNGRQVRAQALEDAKMRQLIEGPHFDDHLHRAGVFPGVATIDEIDGDAAQE